jgi:sec-independent protein translocase protein TatA
MGGLSLWHWIIIIAVVALAFGKKGKISELMGDVAQGFKAFKKGLQDDERVTTEPKASEPVKAIDHQANDPVAVQSESRKAG